MTLVASVLCDECGSFGDGGAQQAHVLRERLRRLGWRVGMPGGVDLCPDCQRSKALISRLKQASKRAGCVTCLNGESDG